MSRIKTLDNAVRPEFFYSLFPIALHHLNKRIFEKVTCFVHVTPLCENTGNFCNRREYPATWLRFINGCHFNIHFVDPSYNIG